MKTNNPTHFNPNESWDEDPRVYGWVLGIDGEAMLGVGRTKREAYDDAMSHDAEGLLEKRGGDFYFYPCSEYFYRGADEEGDGYLSNNFTHYSKRDPQTEFSVVFLDNQRDAAVEAIAATWEASWRKSLKLGDGTYVAWVTVAKNDAKRFTETLDDDANVISYEEIG